MARLQRDWVGRRTQCLDLDENELGMSKPAGLFKTQEIS